MRGIQTKVAAGFSLVALGSLAGYAVGAGATGDQPAQTTAAKRPPVEVRTQTIRRTVRIVKHEKPRHVPSQPLGLTAPSAPARVTAVAAVPRVAPGAPRAATPPPNGSTPVRTRTSGGGSAGRGEHEHAAGREAGDD
jgi:hypothetical protein